MLKSNSYKINHLVQYFILIILSLTYLAFNAIDVMWNELTIYRPMTRWCNGDMLKKSTRTHNITILYELVLWASPGELWPWFRWDYYL